MKRKIVWGGAVLVIAAVLAYFLWPMPLGEVLPEDGTIAAAYNHAGLDGNGNTFITQDSMQLAPDSAEAQQIHAILDSYTYHRSWRTPFSSMERGIPIGLGDAGDGILLHVDGRGIQISGTSLILIGEHVYRIGYWGDRQGAELTAQLMAVLQGAAQPD
nr:hypothetical protein [uncultured Agathobaculum sp.]